MSDSVEIRHGSAVIVVNGLGMRAAAIRAASDKAAEALRAWFTLGRRALDSWTGPHAARFVDLHAAAAVSWGSLIVALDNAAASCASVGSPRPMGPPPAPAARRLPAPDAGTFGADPTELRRFAVAAVHEDPSALAARVTTEGITAQVYQEIQPPIAPILPPSLFPTGPLRSDPMPYPVGLVVHLEAPTAIARDAAARSAEAGAFAALVAAAVTNADQGLLERLLVAGTSARRLWLQEIADGRAATPAQLEKLLAGQDAFDALEQACEDRDHDEIERLLAVLREHAGDPGFQLGFWSAVGSDDPESRMNDLIEDGMKPAKHGGPFGWALDFGEGAWESVWGTLMLGWDTGMITMFTDPKKYVETVRGLGSGIWHGVQHPGDLVAALVNVEGFRDNKGRWDGGFLPDVVLAVFTTGGGAAVKAGDAARDVERLGDAANDLRRLEEGLEVAKDAGRVGEASRGLKVDGDLAERATKIAESRIASGTDPTVARRVADKIVSGLQFDRDQSIKYLVNQLRLKSGKILDSYVPRAGEETGEIVSRKYTQLSEVKLETAKGYVSELASKYKPGEVIADSPSVRKLEDQLGADLVGQRLDGRMVLEVPPQSGALPEDLIDFATKKQVSIRDSAGSWVLKVGP